MNTEEPDQNKQPLPSKHPGIWKILSIVFGVLVLGMVGVYAWGNSATIKQWFAPVLPINDAGGKCLNGSPNYCTADLREMCSPDGKEKKIVPSDCSCGEDAGTLIAKGWRDCKESAQNNQQFLGTVKTGAQLGEVKSYCSEGLYLVADEGNYLTGQTTILQLRIKGDSGNKLFSDQKYIGKKVRVTGKYPAQEVFCEALICGCDDYILMERIEIVEAAKPNPTYSEAEAKTIISSRAAEVILALKNQDLSKLATYIHLSKGVRFSPYVYVNTQENLVFSADKIRQLSNDKKKYVWGTYEGSGFPIELTFEEYFKGFVYTHDFVNAKEITYNRLTERGNMTNNVFEAYPNDIVVEYYFPPSDPKYGGLDWASLRLVFEKFNGSWDLVGVVHDEWTI